MGADQVDSILVLEVHLQHLHTPYLSCSTLPLFLSEAYLNLVRVLQNMVYHLDVTRVYLAVISSTPKTLMRFVLNQTTARCSVGWDPLA